MQIVLDTRGLEVSVRNQCFQFSTEAESRIIHPGRITSIIVTAPCRISSPALQLAATNQIPFVICDNKGSPVVRTWSPFFINISTLRRKQYEFIRCMDSCTWSAEIIRKKIEGQVSNLFYIANRKPALTEQVNKADNDIKKQSERLKNPAENEMTGFMKQVLFIEAYAASKYWQLAGIKLPEPFTFTNRIKRSPEDQFNASINYLYGMLRNHTESAILTMGLDPALGIMHRDNYKTPSLVFDMMEPFRPVADRILFKAILEDGFIETDQEFRESHLLTRQYRIKLITKFNATLETRISYNGSTGIMKNLMLSEIQNLVNKIKKS